MTRRLLAVLALFAVLAAGCKKTETPATRANAAASSDVGEDVEPDTLLEQAPKTKTDRLIAQAEKSASFCEAWDALDRLEQPDLGDPKEVVLYVDRAYSAYLRIDPTRKVQERVPAQRGRPATVRHIVLPDEVQADIDTVRKALYAYWVRVGAFNAWAEAGKIDKAGYDRRMQNAFAALTADPVTQAQQRLMSFEASHC